MLLRYNETILVGVPYRWNDELLETGGTPDVLRDCGSWVYVDMESGTFFRDAIGGIPLYYTSSGMVGRTPAALGDDTVYRVPPGTVVKIDGSVANMRDEALRKAWKINNEYITGNAEICTKAISRALKNAAKRLERYNGIVVLLSGGLDSAISATLLRDRIKYAVTLSGGGDLENARIVAKELGLDLIELDFPVDEIEAEIPAFLSSVPLSDGLQFVIGMGYWMIARFLERKTTMVLSGQGADELFGGYAKFDSIAGNSEAINKLSRELILALHRSNIERDDAIFATNGITHITPYLDPEVLMIGLSIDGELKVPSPGQRKYILRKVARVLGVPGIAVKRQKKAFQYGSGMKKKLQKIATRNGMKKIWQLLEKKKKELSSMGGAISPVAIDPPMT